MGNSIRCRYVPHSYNGTESTRETDNHILDSPGRKSQSMRNGRYYYSAPRLWPRISRRRRRESSLTLPYESSKTLWPVSQLESIFLPEFPIISDVRQGSFEQMAHIADGAFGKVYKVKYRETGKIYALKVLSKAQVIREQAAKQVKNEVHIQGACGHHPFIVNCCYYWQCRKRLYIVSDFVDGGELHQLLETYRKLSLALVRVYVAELAIVLDFLHNAGVIYRDLKPENILLDGDGHVNLIDFGLSKWVAYGNKTKTLCGTLRYMAPEVAKLQPYGHSADWWSLGVIACRMLTGQFPAPSVGGSNANRLPGALPEAAILNAAEKDLLVRLLDVDPLRRLHSLRTLKTIAFYKGYQFKDVEEKKISPNNLLAQYLAELRGK